MNAKDALMCSKCYAKMFVDRVFLTQEHLELYCLRCGRREMYHHPNKHGERIQWIMSVEKMRARRNGSIL
jgi:predicted nucleic-acid-binding Zn-ribbon protein